MVFMKAIYNLFSGLGMFRLFLLMLWPESLSEMFTYMIFVGRVYLIMLYQCLWTLPGRARMVYSCLGDISCEEASCFHSYPAETILGGCLMWLCICWQSPTLGRNTYGKQSCDVTRGHPLIHLYRTFVYQALGCSAVLVSSILYFPCQKYFIKFNKIKYNKVNTVYCTIQNTYVIIVCGYNYRIDHEVTGFMKNRSN